VGDSYTVEFAASKTVAKVYDVGFAGITSSRSPTRRTVGTRECGRPWARGECGFPKVMTFVSLRWAHELSAHDRPEGDTVTLTVTKRF
jgi:hypothetical protein